MGLGGRPQRAHRRRPGLPSRVVPARVLQPPVGSYLSPPPRPLNSPPPPQPPTAPCAELCSRDAPWAPARSSFPGAGGRDGGLEGASWGPGACTIVDARGLVPVGQSPPPPPRRPKPGHCGPSVLGARLGSRADPAPAAPTPGARSLGSPQRRRRASAPRPSARFLFSPQGERADDAPRTRSSTGKPRPSGKWPRGQGWEWGGRGGTPDSPLCRPWPGILGPGAGRSQPLKV